MNYLTIATFRGDGVHTRSGVCHPSQFIHGKMFQIWLFYNIFRSTGKYSPWGQDADMYVREEFRQLVGRQKKIFSKKTVKLIADFMRSILKEAVFVPFCRSFSCNGKTDSSERSESEFRLRNGENILFGSI